MKGDFSRLSFDPAKHYSGVRMQQGRVQLDADWNEQADIIAHRIATEIKDFIGESGAPEKDAGFKISVGGALKLNGENAYMTVENLNIPAEIWTIEFWFRWDGDGDRKNCLFSLGDTVAVSITNGQLKPEVQNMPVIASGRWYHIAFVYDQQSCLVYLDGNSYGEIEIGTTASGTFHLGANSSGTDYFNGAFDELRIWKKARWQSEINKWKDSPLPMNDEGWDTDVLGYWTFDSKNELGKNYKANSPDGNPINCEPLELFTIGKGRYYVDGMLIENEANVLYEQQPDYPDATLPEGDGDGNYLFYLDVWQRHISALEDPAIREVALGGPDTAARIKNVWQVKCIADGEDKPFQISSGTLRAEQPAAGTTLENRLYRVEIHESGSWDKATFKWSRDNGSVGARVESLSGNKLVLSGLVAPATALFKPGEWLELTDDAHELKNEPGVFVKITDLHADGVSVEGDIPADYTDPQQLGARNTRVIRWDGGEPCAINAAQPIDGIALTFSEGTYRSGDYWLIPMRAASGGIEWPAGSAQPPHGVYHHYVDLAVAEKGGDGWTIAENGDLRKQFKTQTTGLVSKAGDTMTGLLTIAPHELTSGEDALQVCGDVTIHTAKIDTLLSQSKVHIGHSTAQIPMIELIGVNTHPYIYLTNGDGSSKIQCIGGETNELHIESGNVVINTAQGSDFGGVAIGKSQASCTLDVNGPVCAHNINNGSDIRHKRDIRPLVNALEKVSKLCGVSFEWRSDEYPQLNFTPGRHIGVVAQEVEQVLPEVVSTDADGLKSVAYGNIVALLIEAIKELTAANTALAQRVSELEAR